jgi:hypothetical protein
MSVALTFTLLKINAWAFVVVFLYSWYEAGGCTIEAVVTVAAQACVLVRVFSVLPLVRLRQCNPIILCVIQFVCVALALIMNSNTFIVWSVLGCVFPLCVGLLENESARFSQTYVDTCQPRVLYSSFSIAWMSMHHALAVLISQLCNGDALFALSIGFLFHQTGLLVYLTRVSIPRTCCSKQPQAVIETETRAPRHLTFLYVTTAPVLFAAFLYYDVIILFILLYTNHVQIPAHIQDYHGLTWFEKDSLSTMAAIACLYSCTLDISIIMFRHIALSQRFLKYAFHLCVALRVVSMWALVDPELSIYAGSVSAILSGSYNLRTSLPTYTKRIDRIVEITTSVILVILFICSIHLDSQIASVLVPLIVASACTICIVFQIVVVYANCKPDTSVFDSIGRKCNRLT